MSYKRGNSEYIICYLCFSFDLNPSADLSQEHQVKDDGRGKERVQDLNFCSIPRNPNRWVKN
jgi:hypothetical protein